MAVETDEKKKTLERRKMLVADMVKRTETMKSDRVNWETWWQDCAKYCLPYKADITEKKASGTKHDTDIYDSTARRSSQILAAGLMSYLTNPTSEWFVMETDEELMKDDATKAFFAAANKKQRAGLQASNFYNQLHENYKELGVFGTAGMYNEEDPEIAVRYFSREIKELLFCENERGKIDQVYRVFELSVRQAYLRWGANAGKTVNEKYLAKKYDECLDFIHVVTPREAYDKKKADATNKPIASYWISKIDKHLISEGGYEEMPFNIARWDKKTGEKHGYSPAMDCLPEIKTANAIKKTMLRQGQKMVDPPIILPHDGYTLPINMNAKGTNYKTSSIGVAGAEEKIEVLRPEGSLAAGETLLADERQTIKETFFVDLFLLLISRKNMTAEEVAQRVEEKMLILGPVIGRLQDELLGPMLTRDFMIRLRRGDFGDVPPQLVGQPLKPKYVSLLAKAQRLAESRTTQNFLMVVGSIAQLDPRVVDKVDLDEVVNILHDLSGVDPKVLRKDEDVKDMREQRAQQEAELRKLALAQAGSEVMKTASETDKNVAESNPGTKKK